MNKIKIPLFDIDLTLLNKGGKAGYDRFACALKKVYGINGSINEIVPHGMIDPQIIIEILKLHSIREEDVKEKMDEAINVMTEYFSKYSSEGDFIPMKGAREILSELQDSGIKIGVLTGNIEKVAELKLKKSGLNEYISFGAFGDMAYKRVDLIDVARKELDQKFSIKNADFVIVGDSPLDIECAKAGGIKSIAVAAGYYNADSLSKAKPDLLVNSLLDEEKIIGFLKN